MRNIGIIPRLKNAKKIYVWGWITFFDVAIVFAFGFFSAMMGLFMATLIGWIFGLIVGLIIFLLSTALLLIPMNRRQERMYYFIFNWFKFLATNKKFKFEEGAATTSLFKIKNIENKDSEILFDGKESGLFARAIKVNGFDLFSLSDSDGEMRLSGLQQMFFHGKSNYTILKLEEEMELEKVKKYRAKLSKREMDNNVQKLMNFQNNEIDRAGDPSVTTEATFYFVFYNEIIETLNSDIEQVTNKMRQYGLHVKVIHKFKTIKMLTSLMGIELDIKTWEESIEKSGLDFNEALSYASIEFKTNHFIVNNSLYRNVSVVDEYPEMPQLSWLSDLANSCQSFVMHVKSEKDYGISKSINKAILSSETSLEMVNKKNRTEIAKKSKQTLFYEDVLNTFTNDDERWVAINTYVITSANSKDDLEKNLKLTKEACLKNKISLNELWFNQWEAMQSAQITQWDYLSARFRQFTTTRTIAESFPFLNENLIEERGFIIGKDKITGQPVIIDLFKNILGEDHTRPNANGMIFGTTGAGKSTLATNILINQITFGRNVFIFDVDREYKKLAKYVGGYTIQLGVGEQGRINPLEMFNSFNDDSEDEDYVEDLEAQIGKQIMFLSEWFNVLYTDWNSRKTRYFEHLIYKFYKSRKLKNIESMTSKDWPTFTTLNDWLKKTNFKNDVYYNPEFHKEFCEIVELDFVSGRYSKIYNGHSSIEVKSQVIVFDVMDLIKIGNKKIMDSQFLLIFAFIQNQLLKKGFYQKEETVIFFDEMQVFLSGNSSIVMKNLNKLARGARKRNAQVLTATQHIGDFDSNDPEVIKQISSIKKSSTYMVILKVTPDEIETADRMLEYVGGLTDAQRQQIIYAEKSNGILFVGQQIKLNLRFEFNDLIDDMSDKKKKEVTEKWLPKQF